MKLNTLRTHGGGGVLLLLFSIFIIRFCRLVRFFFRSTITTIESFPFFMIVSIDDSNFRFSVLDSCWGYSPMKVEVAKCSRWTDQGVDS